MKSSKSKSVKMGLARAALPVIGLFVIIPACVLIFAGLSVQTLLAIVLIFQLYILSIQTEIASKQTAMYAADYQPDLRVKSVLIATEERPYVNVTLSNSGKYPAYHLTIDLRDNETRKILTTQPEVGTIAQLPEGRKIPFIFWAPECYDKKSITIHVKYHDVFGEHRDVAFGAWRV